VSAAGFFPLSSIASQALIDKYVDQATARLGFGTPRSEIMTGSLKYLALQVFSMGIVKVYSDQGEMVWLQVRCLFGFRL
jgi:hypothetical protein